jgi:hypothetical protein
MAAPISLMRADGTNLREVTPEVKGTRTPHQRGIDWGKGP